MSPPARRLVCSVFIHPCVERCGGCAVAAITLAHPCGSRYHPAVWLIVFSPTQYCSVALRRHHSLHVEFASSTGVLHQPCPSSTEFVDTPSTLQLCLRESERWRLCRSYLSPHYRPAPVSVRVLPSTSVIRALSHSSSESLRSSPSFSLSPSHSSSASWALALRIHSLLLHRAIFLAHALSSTSNKSRQVLVLLRFLVLRASSVRCHSRLSSSTRLVPVCMLLMLSRRVLPRLLLHFVLQLSTLSVSRSISPMRIHSTGCSGRCSCVSR